MRAGLDALRAEVTQAAELATPAVEELRELSRGIHPSILTEGGLLPALNALGRRSPVRVVLDLGVEYRLPDHGEVAAYGLRSTHHRVKARKRHACVGIGPCR